MRTVAPDTLRVVLETKDAPLRASVTRALAPERVRIRTIDAPEGTNAPDERPDGLIVDASLDVPGLLETARREGWLGRSTPVFALMDDPLPRETQLEWLGTGVWEFVRLPLDGELFALRLRNLLRARSTGVDSGEPYGWAALRRVADESVALARRFGRPLTVVGFGLDWKQPLDD
ncbi:MAG TPA: hypothetical protein VK966_12235, partial [Longimicrobiales bacterium]|nr:hypothetical protein [Longimicrobiales bacterium]